MSPQTSASHPVRWLLPPTVLEEKMKGRRSKGPRPCCKFLVIIFPDLSQGIGRSKPNCTFIIFKDSFYLSHCDWLPALIMKSFCFILFSGPMIKGLYISGIFRLFCLEVKKYNTEFRKILKDAWGREFDFHDQKDRHVDFSYFTFIDFTSFLWLSSLQSTLKII